ncbi:TPA: DnaA/Hda family protein [Streptococcus suis]
MVQINSTLTLENFHMTDKNQWAYAASQTVSTHVGNMFNPVFMFGETGTGKTHLLHAIANEVLKVEESKKIHFYEASQFTAEFLIGLVGEEMDLLLVDDLQDLPKDKVVEEAFLLLLNHAHNQNKQIVLTANKIPEQLDHLNERLTSRYRSGLTIEITK